MLNELRKEIDELDDTLLKVVESRFNIVKKIAEYKKNHQLPISNKKREEEIIQEKLQKIVSVRQEFVRELFALLFEESKLVQEEIMKRKEE